MSPKALLDRFLDLLKEENALLIQSVKDKNAAKKLEEVVAKKEEVLRQILALEREDIEPFADELQEIDAWTERNKTLAVNNIEFINEIFDAIYAQNSPTQYTKDGTISTKKKGFFNKKV